MTANQTARGEHLHSGSGYPGFRVLPGVQNRTQLPERAIHGCRPGVVLHLQPRRFRLFDRLAFAGKRLERRTVERAEVVERGLLIESGALAEFADPSLEPVALRVCPA